MKTTIATETFRVQAVENVKLDDRRAIVEVPVGQCSDVFRNCVAENRGEGIMKKLIVFDLDGTLASRK